LRERKWFSHNAVDAPTTITSIFEVVRWVDPSSQSLLMLMLQTSLDTCHITQNPELTPESSTKHSPTSRKPNADPDQVDVPDPNSSKWTTFEHDPETLALRKKLQLLPQLKSSDVPANIKQRIVENSDDFFNRCNLEEADVYFIRLPKEHRFRLVEKLIAHALSVNYEADARLVSYFFAQVASNGQCTSDIFEKGFMPMACLLDEVAINFPMAYYYMAVMLKGAGFENEPERLLRIASKLKDSNNLLSHFSLHSLQ
jgi:translation initiation factor 4G